MAEIVFIGKVRSELTRKEMCPKTASEGAPNGIVQIRPEYEAAMQGLTAGAELIVLTWLHMADRQTQRVHPRRNPDNPLTGVFMTRSPDRPNPIGLHRVELLQIEGLDLHVSAIEVLNDTPVIDIKIAKDGR